MFQCNCGKRCRFRTQFILHKSVCGKTTCHNHNRFSILSDEDEESDVIDDSDVDPTWDPYEADCSSSIRRIENKRMVCSDSNMSLPLSPLTKEQIDISRAAEKLLIEESPVTDSNVDSNWKSPKADRGPSKSSIKRRLFSDPVKSLTSSLSLTSHLLNETNEEVNFSSMSKTLVVEDSEPSNGKNMSYKEKLHQVRQKIEIWKEKRKMASKVGKKSMTRRLSKSINKMNKVVERTLMDIDCEEVQSIEETKETPTKPQPSGSAARKRNYCIYCNKLVAKFSEHVEKCHPDKTEVKPLLQIAKSSLAPGQKRLEKLKITNKLRKLWNDSYNNKQLSESVEPHTDSSKLIPVKRSHSGQPLSCVVCQHCKGLYSRRKLSYHIKACSAQLTLGHSSTQAIKQHSFPVIKNKNSISESFKNDILKGVNIDFVMQAALDDPLIMKFGSEFHESRREPCSKHYVIREMRDVGKLLVKMKSINPEIKNLKDCLNPSYFETMIQAVRDMAQYNDQTGSVNVPSIAYRLMQPLKDIAKIVRTEELSVMYKTRSNDTTIIKMIDDFLSTMDDNWAKKIGRICTKSQKFSKAERNTTVALEKDIVKLASFIECSYGKLLRSLEKDNNKCETYDLLTHMLVTHIMLLIRRRPVDFKHANLNHYKNLDKHDELIDMAKGTTSQLSLDDLETCKQFHIFYVPGKNLEVVPMVLTPLMKKTMDALLKYRHHVGITGNSLFVLSYNRLIKPNESIKLMKRKVTLLKPKDLTGNGLRHQAATFSKLHSTHPQYQDFLASALGHTLSIHKKHYDLPTGILQKIMVCPILNNIMKGNTTTHDEITALDQPLNTPNDCPNISNNAILEPTSDENDSSSDSSLSDKSFKPKCKRRKWKPEEEVLVLRHFSKKILEKIVPTRSEVCQFLKEKGERLKQRTTAQVYIYVRNHSTRQQKNVTPKVQRYL